MRRWLRPVFSWHRSEHIVLGGLAIVVGALAGIGSILFRDVIELTQVVAFGPGALAERASLLPAWHVVAIPTLGGLLIGVLCARVLPPGQPQGVANVIEAAALRGSRIDARDGASAALVNALAIVVGGSVGREGPIVHLGAALAALVSTRLNLPARSARTLLGCGVAAAVAAAFNAPIAGVFFALEVVIGHYALTAFSPVVIASVIGTIISRLRFGDTVAFDLPPQTIVSFFEVPAFILLGLVAGAAAIVLLKAISVVDRLHDRLAVPQMLRPALAGLLTGVVAVAFPQVLGIGYETTDAALRGNYAVPMLLSIALAKGLATAVCLGSRFGGGIFSPALVLGALIGVAFDDIAGMVLPTLSSAGVVYGILGMGAFAGAVLGAPISTTIMVFELTHDYGVTFALMAAVAVASLFTMQVHGHSFFTWQLQRRGINLRHALEQSLLARQRVADVLRREPAALPATATLDELARRFQAGHAPLHVVDADGRLLGEVPLVVLVETLVACTPDASASASTAGDLVRRPALVLDAGDDLSSAWHRARTLDVTHIPVVRSRDDPVLLGHVRQHDLLLAHERAITEARALERGDA